VAIVSDDTVLDSQTGPQGLGVRESWCMLRVRWGRVRSAERAEAHLLEIDFCEPSFGPMCGQRAIR
jgi:hypothetical protein